MDAYYLIGAHYLGPEIGPWVALIGGALVVAGAVIIHARMTR